MTRSGLLPRSKLRTVARAIAYGALRRSVQAKPGGRPPTPCGTLSGTAFAGEDAASGSKGLRGASPDGEHLPWLKGRGGTLRRPTRAAPPRRRGPARRPPVTRLARPTKNLATDRAPGLAAVTAQARGFVWFALVAPRTLVGKATGVASLLRRIAAPLAVALLAAGLAAEPAVAAPALPKVESKHAVLVEASTGAVLWQRDAHRPTLVASTTKILTALVAQETWPPAKIITVPTAAERVDGTRLGYQTGMRIRRRDLVAALLQISANDAAETLAAAYPGGRAGFIRAMQAKADALGCADSTWRDPSGLDAPGHKASAADLAVVGRALLAVPELAAVVRLPSIRYRWPDGRLQYIAGHNRFVSDGEDPGALGIKTGFTAAAQHTIVAAQRRGGRTLIAVALGAPSAAQDRDDVRAMFRYGFATTAKVGAEILGVSAVSSISGSATAPAGASPQPAAQHGGAAALATTPRGGALRWIQGRLLVAPIPLAALVAIVLLLIGMMTVRSSDRSARSRHGSRAPADEEPEDQVSGQALTVAPPTGSFRSRGGGR